MRRCGNPRHPGGRHSRFLSASAGPSSVLELSGLTGWYVADPAYCFQDAAATTPCGNGDPVYTWVDQSGGARNMVQATLSLRPTLTLVGGTTWAVLFDGTDDYMAATYSAVMGTGRAYGVRANATKTSAFQVMSAYRSSVSEFRLSNTNPGAVQLTVSNGVAAASAGQITLSADFRATGYADHVADTAYCALDGVAGSTVADTSSSPGNDATEMALGARTSLSLYLGGQIYRAVFCDEALDASERAFLESYLS